MPACMRCDRDTDSSESADITFENKSMTITGFLCPRCAKEFLDWLLKEDED